VCEIWAKGCCTLLARNLTHADELKNRFPDQLWIGKLDLSDLANVRKAFQAAVDYFGRVHAVVSNAGYSVLGAAEETPVRRDPAHRGYESARAIELARVAIAHMRALGGGRLVQISSGAGQAGFAGLSIYCATKWGIEGFFELLRRRWSLWNPDDACRAGYDPDGVWRIRRSQPGVGSLSRRPVGILRKMASDGYTAPGDPAKMAKAIVDTFEAEHPPMRLALGPDVYGYIKAALTSRLEQIEAQKGVTMATDCDDIETAKIR